MSFQLPSRHPGTTSTTRHASAAFLVEAMLLLVFLIASLAVFMQMFSASLNRAEQARELTEAVAAASDVAERFAAYPDRVGGEEVVGDMLVMCDVSSEPQDSGVLYTAEITVYPVNDGGSPAGEPMYSLSTARFEGQVE